jgi:hypothetical protein
LLACELAEEFLIEALTDREMDVARARLADAQAAIQRVLCGIDADQEYLISLVVGTARATWPDRTRACDTLCGKDAPAAPWATERMHLVCMMSAGVDAGGANAQLAAILIRERCEEHRIKLLPH